MYSHGNSGDIGRIIDNYIDLALNLGVNVLGYDYSGYGESTGNPTDANLILDIEACYKFLRNELKFD